MVYSATTPAPAVSGNINQTVLDFHNQVPPQVAKELYTELGESANNFINLLRMFGRKMYVPYYKFSAQAEGRITSSFTTTGSVTQAAADTAAVLTIATGSHVLDGTTTGYTYPNVGDIVTLPPSVTNQYYMQCRVVAKDTTTYNQHTISIVANDKTLAIGTVASGTVINITSQSSAAQTGKPAGKYNLPLMRDFYLQISKRTVEQDGRTLISPTWTSPNGTFDILMHKTQILLEKDMNGALLLGDETDATAQAISATEAAAWGGDGAGNIPTTTKGIWRWGKDLGGEVQVLAGAESLTDFRAIKEYELTQGINASNFLCMGGYRRIYNYSAAIKTANANSGDKYIKDMLSGNANIGDKAGYAAYFDFASIALGSANFNLCELAEFSDPNMLGGTGFNGTNQMITIPISQVRSAQDANISWANFAIMYMANNGYSRELEEITVAGAGGGVYNIEVDKKGKHLRTDFGAFCMGANQIYITTP